MITSVDSLLSINHKPALKTNDVISQSSFFPQIHTCVCVCVIGDKLKDKKKYRFQYTIKQNILHLESIFFYTLSLIRIHIYTHKMGDSRGAINHKKEGGN